MYEMKLHNPPGLPKSPESYKFTTLAVSVTQAFTKALL